MDFGIIRFFLSRLIKPLILASMTFFAMRILGFSNAQAAIASAWPLVAGATNVFVASGYTFATAVCALAILLSVYPEAKGKVPKLAAEAIHSFRDLVNRQLVKPPNDRIQR